MKQPAASMNHSRMKPNTDSAMKAPIVRKNAALRRFLKKPSAGRKKTTPKQRLTARTQGELDVEKYETLKQLGVETLSEELGVAKP